MLALMLYGQIEYRPINRGSDCYERLARSAVPQLGRRMNRCTPAAATVARRPALRATVTLALAIASLLAGTARAASGPVSGVTVSGEASAVARAQEGDTVTDDKQTPPNLIEPFLLSAQASSSAGGATAEAFGDAEVRRLNLENGGLSLHAKARGRAQFTGSGFASGSGLVRLRFEINSDNATYSLRNRVSLTDHAGELQEDGFPACTVSLRGATTQIVQEDCARRRFVSSRGSLPRGSYQLELETRGRGAKGTNSAAAALTFAIGSSAPADLPIVFVPGFAGSKIACLDDQLFPNVPVEFPLMRLEADGKTNMQQGACSPLARPTEILESFLGLGDVYAPTVEFLQRIAPDNHYTYAWDWRKSPQLALDLLDLIIERARCGGALPEDAIVCADPAHEQVVLMAHSMGGLVIQDYINDQSRADKVARALTVGTPYWGSPKSIFPLALGQESPGASLLDGFIRDEQFSEWARNAQGLYFLYPSASFGDWLTVGGRAPRPLDRAGLLDYVSELGGTRALLEHALEVHAQSLDGFRRNGVDLQAFVGSGLATFERVLFFRAADRDYVKVTYAHGDGTVPVRSGAQGAQGTADPLGENIPIHYSCGIKHLPLPGDPAVTTRIEDFLLSGAPVSGAATTNCDSTGFQIEIYEIAPSPSAAARASVVAPEPTVRAVAGVSEPMTLQQAEIGGLVDLVDLGHQKIIVTDSRTPVELSYSSERYDVNITPLADADLGETKYYGPLSGPVNIAAGSTVSITDAAGEVTPRSDGAPELSIADASVAEGTDVSITVTLSRPTPFPVVVDFETEDGSASAPGDYSARDGTLILDPGTVSKTVTVPTIADEAQEGSETFRVRLSNAQNARISREESVVTIQGSGEAAGNGPVSMPALIPGLPTMPGSVLSTSGTRLAPAGLTLGLSLARAGSRLASSRRLPLAVSCDQRCSGRIRVVLPHSPTGNSRSRTRTIAVRGFALEVAGQRRLTLRLNRSGLVRLRAALRGRRSLMLTVRATARGDAASASASRQLRVSAQRSRSRRRGVATTAPRRVRLGSLSTGSADTS